MYYREIREYGNKGIRVAVRNLILLPYAKITNNNLTPLFPYSPAPFLLYLVFLMRSISSLYEA